MDPAESNITAPEINNDRLIDSLFRTQLTLPYDPPIRWWEDQTGDILFLSKNVHDVRRVIRFHLFGREHTPRYVLRARDSATMTSFLIQVSPWDERPFVCKFTQQEKIDRFISLCHVSNTVANQWFFYPSQFEGDTAQAVARKIDSESTRLFRSVPFEEWLRYALGYPSPTVAWLLELHEEFYQMLTMYLDIQPEETSRFLEVEKHLRSRCPFAYLAVQRCLQDIGALPRCDDPPEQWHMGFLVKPIRHLFRPENRDLICMLKRLSLLSIRFARRYQFADRIDWDRPFHVESYYLDTLLSGILPKALARVYTRWDQHNSTILMPHNFINRDLLLRFLNANWLQLAKCAGECYVSNPDTFGYLQILVMELHTLKNYHAASAILHGLKWIDEELFNNTDVPSDVERPPGGLRNEILPLLYLVDSRGHYRAYRRVMKERPGVPFIWAHAKDFYEKGPAALEGFFL